MEISEDPNLSTPLSSNQFNPLHTTSHFPLSEESNTDLSVVSPARDEIVEDYTDVFATKVYFETRDDLIKWVRAAADEHGIVVVVKRSDNGSGRKRPRLFLACERGGLYRKCKMKSFRGSGDEEVVDDTVDVREGVNGEDHLKKRKRKSGTKKCGCPFLLKGREISVKKWALEVQCGVHNHPVAQQLNGQSYAGRLSKAEEEFVIDMSKSNSRPKDILEKLQQKFPDNKSIMRTIYNARLKHRVIEKKAGKSQMQYLLDNVKARGYFHLNRRCEKTDTVKDIFFAHPTGVDLLRAFPRVLLMDCTYKTETDRYMLPLLEIVGVTSTGMTFHVACACMESSMESEREDNYVWACGVLKSLMEPSYLPNAIVTGPEKALVNAIETSFPTSKHLLCRWHIGENITANCKKMFRTKEKWDSFIYSWNVLVYADNEPTFNELLRRFQLDYVQYPAAVEYAMKQWIHPYKEKFVSAWTNNIMHYGNTTTNRAESCHLVLKTQLDSIMGSFEMCWAKILTLLETSHNAIKASFEASVNVVENQFNSNVFKSLRGVISIDGLSKILDEMNGIPDVGQDPLLCDCVLRKTCGLPCAHEISEFVREDKPIPVDMIDGFWRKLNMEPTNEVDVGVGNDINSLWDKAITELKSKFAQANYSEKLLMLKRVREIANTNFVD